MKYVVIIVTYNYLFAQTNIKVNPFLKEGDTFLVLSLE